jgi:hypothetical protein
MPISALTGLYIDETYPRLVQTNDTRTEFANGLGQAITFGTTSPGDGDQAIQFNSASVFSGSAKLKYDYINSNIILTGSILLSGSSFISGVDYIDFDTTASNAGAVARLKWNDVDGTLDLGLKGGNVTLQIGQEEVVHVVNKSGVNLTEAGYQAVKVLGAQGQRLSIILAQGNNDANSQDTLGLVTEDIAVNQEGFITTVGLVRGINTTGNLQGETWNEGDQLYLSPSTAGRITNIPPKAPQHTVRIGYVVSSNANNGSIFVKVDNGYEIDELHNVLINTGSLTSGQLLVRSGSVWINSTQLTGSYGLTGSLVVTQNISASSFTGSLFGTASWASNALTASYVTASKVIGIVTSASYAITSSYVETAQTASYVLASNVDGTVTSASYAISASYASTASYTQNFVEATFPRINLISDMIDPPGLPYVISVPGIYQILTAGSADPSFSSYPIIFPNPTTLNGTTITILNADTIYPAAVDNPDNLIKSMSGTNVTSISNISAAIFKAIDNKWWKLY